MRDKHLERAVKKLLGFGGNGRSALHRYIAENFETLSGRNIGSGGPTWEEITEVLNWRGQRNSRGEVLTVIAVKRVFQRVARDLASKPVRQPKPEALRVRAPASWQPAIVVTDNRAPLPPQPKVASPAAALFSQRLDGHPSLLTKPKTPEQLIAEVALKKPARDRTPEEKIAVLIAGQQDRSYSG